MTFQTSHRYDLEDDMLFWLNLSFDYELPQNETITTNSEQIKQWPYRLWDKLEKVCVSCKVEAQDKILSVGHYMGTSCWKWTGQLGSAVQNKPTVNNVEEKGGEFVTWEAGAFAGWELLTFTLSLMDRLLSLECHHSFLSLECHHSYHSAPFLHQPGAPLCLCLDNLYSSTLRSLFAQSLIFCRCKSYKGLGNPSKTSLMVTGDSPVGSEDMKWNTK